jgi:CRP-like cAMP-binding protein
MVQKADSIRRLFQNGQKITDGKGEVILGNDGSPDGIYFIDSGFIKVYSISDSGDEYLHMIYGQGELFPLVWAFLDMEPESLFYESISNVVLWRLAKQRLTKLARTDIDLNYALSLQLARELQVYIDRIDNLEYKKAGERVAYRLLALAGRFGIKLDGTIAIEAPVTHELLANSINLARESVSREIEKLEKQNIINRKGHQISILDVKGLADKLSQPVSLKNWRLL